MDFLKKLDLMMDKYSLNKRTLSQNSGIPYTTIDGWYKKGYEGMKMSTLKLLSDYFNTILDYWVSDEVTDPNAWKANGFVVNVEEMGKVQKYRLLDRYGQEAVDGVLDVESKRCEAERAAKAQEKRGEIEAGKLVDSEPVIRYKVPGYMMPMSAGTGQEAGQESPEDYTLIKEPPRGTSFIARVSGHSMEPTYYDGDLVFVYSTEDIPVGAVGAFFMDGQQWIKELGDGVLISHNPAYGSRDMREDIRCQGLVLGVCDESYFE